MIFLLSWLYLSPNPRFGLGYFAVIPLSVVLLFSNQLTNFINIKNSYTCFLFYLFSFDCKYIGEKYIQFERFYDFAIQKN